MSAAALTKPAFAVIAEFSSAATLYEAAEKVRDAGYRFWDVHSPFPIHGMNKAMGLKKSPLGYIIFCGGFLGFTTAALPRIRSVVVSLSIDCARQTGGLFHGPGFFPDYVRADGVDFSVYGVFRGFYFEPAATAASSALRSRTIQPGDQRRVLPGHRIGGSEIFADRNSGVSRRNRRRGSHSALRE